jgi:Flp pilus assembly protein TadD
MKAFFTLLVLSLLVWSPNVRADGPDDEYVSIYSQIEQGDTLNEKGKTASALTNYVAAEKALKLFKKNYPDWNPKIVTYRLKYLAEKITSLPVQPPPGANSTNAPAAAPTNAPTTMTTNAPPPSAPEPEAKPAMPPPSTENENQIKGLQEQISALQAGNALLQAKLKEALAAQPAAVDPRELARAQEQIANLQKQNDLLKVSLDEAKNRPAAVVPADTTKTRQALAEASQKAAELEKSNAALALEKVALENQVKKLNVPDPAVAALRDENKNLKMQVADLQGKAAAAPDTLKTQQALAEANQKAAQLQQANASLALEKDALQARVKTLTVPDSTLASLRDENSVLKKQVAELQGQGATASAGAGLEQKLKAAQAQVAALQSDKEILRVENAALQNRLQQVAASPAPAPASPAPPAAPTPARETANALADPMLDSVTAGKLASLEAQRDALQKSLDAANKDIYGRKRGKEESAHIDDMAREIGALRARIETLEAKPVPYSAEELALMARPDVTLMAAVRGPGRKTPKELPAGASALVADAKRYFLAHDLANAEAKYLEVLKLDSKNVTTLADLASIELEAGHLADAEKNIQAALALDPNDDYSLFVLGQLRFAQKNYDQAFDALSRAAQLNPQNAKIQNFLGLTLGEKGLRGPAESAFRKAIQFDPGFAEAHLNLAVVYVTQQPPLVELAKWHYQKALGLGHAPNPGLEALLDPVKAATAAVGH